MTSEKIISEVLEARHQKYCLGHFKSPVPTQHLQHLSQGLMTLYTLGYCGAWHIKLILFSLIFF